MGPVGSCGPKSEHASHLRARRAHRIQPRARNPVWHGHTWYRSEGRLDVESGHAAPLMAAVRILPRSALARGDPSELRNVKETRTEGALLKAALSGRKTELPNLFHRSIPGQRS